ncbi:MAG: peroxiredoxin [Desulfobacterales bacterium]|nr:peroxiredoxin [Desulfobacterales bacterium]
MKFYRKLGIIILTCTWFCGGLAFGQSANLADIVYNPGNLKPRDSEIKIKAGQPAPDFTLPAVSGKNISLSHYRGEKNVVLSFVPAAFTPVCSDQWPGYNIVKDMFDESDAILLGITVDNIPTLYAWTRQMGQLWFEILSDFWPHGAVAEKYGVLRSDGLSERALIFIDKQGIVSAVLVMDINRRPDLIACKTQLKKMKP